MEQVLYQLPDGWEWKSLGDLVGFKNGYAFKSNVFSDRGIPVLRISNIQSGGISDRNMAYIPSEKLDVKAADFYVEPGDIVIAMSGATTGKVATNNTEDRLLQNQRVGRFIITDKTFRKYVLYYLGNKVEENLQKSLGAAQPNLSTAQIKEIKIPIQPANEQKRIVEKLDALLTRIDTAIDHLQESVALKNSLFQSALDGQFSAITERMTIESLAEVKGGKRLPKGEKLSDKETEHPYIRVADFTDKGTIDLSGIKYIPKEIHEQIKRYVISKDDLYISIAGTIGKTGFVPPELDGANLTENAAKLVIKDKQQLDLSYLYLFTLTSDFSAQAGLATKTVAQPKLALTRLSKIEIPMCSLEEQKALVSTIDALKGKIHDAEEVLLGKIEDLKNLKASILDSAFKGEL